MKRKKIKFRFEALERICAEQLMNQQFHVMGRDVESKHGNLLLEYGAIRQKAPCNRTTSSYTFHISKQRRILLRNFGLFIGDDSLGGIFLRRKEFEPIWIRSSFLSPIPWLPHQIPEWSAIRFNKDKHAVNQLLVYLADWFQKYESWIVTKYGRRFRQGQLTHFQRKGNVIWKWNMQDGWSSIKEWLR